MEISQLYYFKTVAKYQSFTRAAEELHITQSALSRSVAQLEGDLGIQLFERKKGGKITLNRNGNFFLHYVVQVLNTLENTVSAVKEMAGLERGVVNIAISEFIFLKNVIFDFLMEHPDVRMNCRLQSQEQMKASLEDGTINFAICKSPIPGADFQWHPLFHDRMSVVLPQNHPLAGRKSIYLDELRQDHFIVSNLGFDMSSEMIRMCHLAGFEPYIVYEGSGEDLCGRLVGAGVGVMLAPYSITQGVGLMGVDMLPLPSIPLADDFAKSQIGAVMKWGQFQSEAALALFDRIVDFYASLPPFELEQSESNDK